MDRAYSLGVGSVRTRTLTTLFAWDGAAKTDKNRKDKPPQYLETRRVAKNALSVLFSTTNCWHPEYEADDVVATAAFNSKADQIYVVSGDKDLMQLQSKNTAYFDLNTKTVLPAATICSKFKVKRPAQVALALAIIGDTSDGIQGIPKWGPKKSEKLFESVTADMDFSSALEELLRQIPKELQSFFMESLDKTLLHTDIEDVPDPSPLVFCNNRDLIHLKIDKLAQGYERVVMQYEGGEESLAEMIKG
ncbi:MAG: hypothetical protein JZU63_05550 [Rhodoferax sp.]|nr:hypothetical protein [Rhodoferax sp.]